MKMRARQANVEDRLSPPTSHAGDDQNETEHEFSLLDSSCILDASSNPAGDETEPALHPDAHPLLPRSSSDLLLSLPQLDKIISCYTSIRSFGFLLRLSPFTLKEFCRDISLQVGFVEFIADFSFSLQQSYRVQNSSSSLIDEVHTSILKILQTYPPVAEEGEGAIFQSDEGCYFVKESILLQVQDQAWRFMDNLSWPEFMRRWIIARGSTGDFDDFTNGREYWHLDTDSKIDLLNLICEDFLDSWIVRKEIQTREQMLEYLLKCEKQEVAEKNRMNRSSNLSRKALSDVYDHLYIREGLDSLESDVCDVTGVGGTLICCDGCPASYLGRSVGLKRVGDDDQKWFCEECRVGGQIRSHRFLHRASSAMRWAAHPPVAIIGQGINGLRCFTAYGRVFVGNGTELYAYYSTVEKLEELINFLKSTSSTTGREPSPMSFEDEAVDSAAKKRLRIDGARGKLRASEASSDDDSDSDDESTWDAGLVLTRKKKSLIEQIKFRIVVEEKQMALKEYVNRYKDAMSLSEVSTFFSKGKERGTKKNDSSSARKWAGWPRIQENLSDSRAILSSVVSYLLQTEKNLFGLVDGPFIKASGRKEWIEWVKQADDVSDISRAAIVFESAIRPCALVRSWFDSSEKKFQGRSRGSGRKSSKKEVREEVDWTELREAGILEDMALPAHASNDDDDESKQYLVWISGKQVMPLGVNLSHRSLRQVVLTAGEAEVRGMMYRGAAAVPSARLVWIREILEAKTTAQLALQLRAFDEALRSDIFRKPATPADLSILSNVVERVVGSRISESGHVQYEVKMFGDDDRVEWMSQENTPIFCIREFEADCRRSAEAESKRLWWKEFDFHPGASVEVESENQWYQGYVVDCFFEKPKSGHERAVGGLKWRDGVNIVRVHYIGGLDEEDEYMYIDDERLRLDKKAEARLLRERARRLREEIKLSKIEDRQDRMQARLELYQERLLFRDDDGPTRLNRDPEKIRDKEKKEQVIFRSGRPY